MLSQARIPILGERVGNIKEFASAFDNLIGFYQILDANGGIDINGDGIADFNPGDAGYTEPALTNRVTGLDLLQTDNGANYNLR